MDYRIFILIAVFWVIMSAAAVYVTKADKSYAKKGKRRIPERTLMLIGLFGGAEAMYITMKKIRHKTKHNKFMIGLPLEIVLHVLLIVGLIFYFV